MADAIFVCSVYLPGVLSSRMELPVVERSSCTVVGAPFSVFIHLIAMWKEALKSISVGSGRALLADYQLWIHFYTNLSA